MLWIQKTKSEHVGVDIWPTVQSQVHLKHLLWIQRTKSEHVGVDIWPTVQFRVITNLKEGISFKFPLKQHFSVYYN